MNKTTRLKKPQIPELEDLYTFDELGGRPKYGGVEMTSETDIPSFQEIMDETHSAVVAEATARDDADEALEAEIQELAGQTSEALENEATARAAADTALQGAIDSEASTRGTADVALQNQIDAIVASSDVKDIVGTKAELDAYDKSTLGDNDIIKVLQDESQSDATTYYRYAEATDSFTLIGSEGPYYTKGQADTLLNAKADKATTYTKTEVDATVSDLEADIATKQDQLTAGSNINIDANNVISGAYTPFTGATASTDGVQGLVPGPLAGDEDKFLKADGTWDTAGSAINVVQTTGTSTTDVMSQKAVTSMVFADPSTKQKVQIGANAVASASYSVSIGRNASTYGANSVAVGPSSQANYANCVAVGDSAKSTDDYTVAIGAQAKANMPYSVAVGTYATASAKGEMNIGTGNQTTAGYNNSQYRLLTGLYDGQNDHDAVTVGQLNTAIAGVTGAAEINSTDWSDLWQ